MKDEQTPAESALTDERVREIAREAQNRCHAQITGLSVREACEWAIRSALAESHQGSASAWISVALKLPCDCYIAPHFDGCSCRNPDDAHGQGYAMGWNACVRAIEDAPAKESAQEQRADTVRVGVGSTASGKTNREQIKADDSVVNSAPVALPESAARFSNWCLASHGHDLVRKPDGNWVKASDYDELRRVAEALIKERK